jgi:glycosyltransferase involved in cell wall biosynthesis
MKANAAIYYRPEGYETKQPRLMGRNAAGEGFLNGLFHHAETDKFYCYSEDRKTGQQFFEAARAAGDSRAVEWIGWHEPRRLAEAGALYLPDPILQPHAWRRRRHDQRAYSLTGVTHTTASAGIMDRIADMAVAPLQEWDAIICTSGQVRSTIQRLCAEQNEYLRQRLGAHPAPMPQLPVIPLGVDCAKIAPHAQQRQVERAHLQIGEEDIAILFMGRLSFHAKAHPLPMYLALENIAKDTGRRIHLLQAGWFANDFIRDAFVSGAKKYCPSVRCRFLDGRKPEVREHIWQAADIFCSLSDNIQETFGLTPIEAMAAGLPSVVSDWDGYKDTVRHGEEGFRVPTLMPPAGSGEDLADRHDSGVDTYDLYCGFTSQMIAVDIDATRNALHRLIDDEHLRRRMGQEARRRALELFDWRHVIASYQELWAELAQRRAKAGESAPRAQPHADFPARMDPFRLFEDYPSVVLSPEHRVSSASHVQDAKALIDHPLVRFAKPVMRLDLCDAMMRRVARGEASVADLTAEAPEAARAAVARNLCWLAKLGLVAIRPPKEEAGAQDA